jgi:alpha-galactosidase
MAVAIADKEVKAKSAAADESSKGHAAHTKTADSQEGLRGDFTRPIHITFLGAGSGFCPTLCRDVLLMGANRGEFRLVDVDRDRLATMHQVISQLIKDTGKENGWTVRGGSGVFAGV